ncbi:hypothetical protein [uncultured Draconibacterium sp.]|uniref:hypothetical protein n=1 Tax=uncultured Draconibacterium sp. TaxID=1573823 RepID=UPI003261967B
MYSSRGILKFVLFSFIFLFCGFNSFGNIVVLNGLTHENNATPGEIYRTQIEIHNMSDEAKSVKIYSRDYYYSHTGETRHDAPGTMDRSNANWITYQPELLNLGPDEKAVVNVEVQVPESNDLSGSYWSVIMVEGVVPPDTSNTVGVSIRTAIRYAVQVITNVGGEGVRDLTFQGLELSKNENENMISVVVQNSGEVLLKPEMSLELFDEEGNSVATLKADKRKTLPGTSIKITILLEGIKPGVYNGVLVADCGDDSIYGTNVSFELL